MSCKKKSACRIRRIKSHNVDCLLSVGDTVHDNDFGYCLVVGLHDKLVYLVRLDSDSRPFGVVFSLPLNNLRVFDVGASVRFRVNGEFVLGVVRKYDCFGNAVVKVDPDYLVGNPIRVYHVPLHSILAEVA